ncbi:tyrosinase family protein [Deinococcus sp. ME38]|uniref:tyrosinase family protein n=1 Tax=Deinococcus sp. ME38 TaxID=3400344 RepID=UPI003B5BA886
MKNRPRESRRSWHYFASMHGTSSPRGEWPAGAIFDGCQHANWFFLPWHRKYLSVFEGEVRRTLAELNYPDAGEWALPYWDYNDESATVRGLPTAFLEETLPDGTPNPLVAPRATQTLPEGNVELREAMRQLEFLDGFGGVNPNFFLRLPGKLELSPHNMVHSALGGWMGDARYAALDPIFWLHHANIDRLWAAWLQLAGGRANPTESAWLDQTFQINDGNTNITFACRDVVDSSTLGYTYESLSEGRFSLIPEHPISAFRPVNSVVGASARDIHLGWESVRVDIPLDIPSGSAQAPRFQLELENVRATQLGPALFDVSIQMPNTIETLRVGRLSTFGLIQSKEKGPHQHGTLTIPFEITRELRALMEAGQWPTRLSVSIQPTPGRERNGEPDGNLTVGRIAVRPGR